MVHQTPHCRFDLLRADTNVQECCSTCIKRTAGNERMDDRLTCGRNVPGSARQTNALLFYSLGNEVDKERSRTASLIYKSIVIGITDKSRHPSSQIWATSFYRCFLKLYHEQSAYRTVTSDRLKYFNYILIKEQTRLPYILEEAHTHE